MLMSRSSAVRRRLGNNPKVSIDYIEASGDCFYLAMEAALCENDGWQPVYAVSTMRELVATSLTEEIYELYVLLHTQKAEGAQSSFALPAAHLLEGRKIELRCQSGGKRVGRWKESWRVGGEL
ncbi:MAG: hypothetical protein SGPRY_009726, partial [Prymnesium sp.]